MILEVTSTSFILTLVIYLSAYVNECESACNILFLIENRSEFFALFMVPYQIHITLKLRKIKVEQLS